MTIEAGTLRLRGVMDSSQLEQSQARVQRGMTEIERRSRANNQSFARLGEESGRVAGNLARIGTVGVGALTALGLASPQVRGQLAEMRATSIELGNTMGNIIEPVLDRLNEQFRNFSGFVSDNQGTIDFFVDNSLRGLDNALNTVSETLSSLGNIWDNVSDKIGGSELMEELGAQTIQRGAGALGGYGIARLLGVTPQTRALATVGGAVASDLGAGEDSWIRRWGTEWSPQSLLANPMARAMGVIEEDETWWDGVMGMFNSDSGD